ncbi:MAG: carboxypeptidase-like regulatory domain-containing protein, partial [Verrucomicrobiota bacterium]
PSVLADGFFQGRVTDNATGKGLEGARLLFDLNPPDGMPEEAAESGPFGFYNATLPPGTYEISAGRGGYNSQTVTVVVASGEHVETSFALDPLVAGGGIDICFQVACVFSGLLLENVPVGIHIFASAGAPTPFEIRTGLTDTNGIVCIRGCPSGFFRFQANDAGDGPPIPKWPAFTTSGTGDDKTPLLQHHSARIQLEPEKTNLTFQALGLNPIALNRFTDTNQALQDVYVELTGVEIDAAGRRTVLVPPRTGVTDAGGNITFRGLPHISWAIRTRKLGYLPFETVIHPHPVTGEFTGPSPKLLRPEMKTNKIFLDLMTEYNTNFFLRDLEVRVQGLEDTNTEGIHITNTTVFSFGNPLTFFYQWRTINRLLPGRYRLSVHGTGEHVEGIVP